MDALTDISELIKRAIVEEPPLAQREGGIIREGYNEDVDKFRRSRTDGKNGFPSWRRGSVSRRASNH